MKMLEISTFYRPKDEKEWPLSASVASKVFSKSQNLLTSQSFIINLIIRCCEFLCFKRISLFNDQLSPPIQ